MCKKETPENSGVCNVFCFYEKRRFMQSFPNLTPNAVNAAIKIIENTIAANPLFATAITGSAIINIASNAKRANNVARITFDI